MVEHWMSLQKDQRQSNNPGAFNQGMDEGDIPASLRRHI